MTPVVLVGQGTFHQVHGGITTREGGVRRRESLEGPTIWEAMALEYERLTGRAPLSLRLKKPLLFGRCETEAAARYFFIGTGQTRTAEIAAARTGR